MEVTNYTSVGPVLQLNKAGELTQKRMKAVKVCDGLYISEPDKNGYTQFICELNDVIWLDCKAAETKIAYGIKRIPSYFKDIKAGCFDGKNIEKFRREISRRINHPDSPVIMKLKKPERKKPAPLAENERKASVLMFKGCTDETIEKKVVITEVAPHIYTYAYKMKRYGERVKVIFEIDGIYFQGSDNGAYVLEREDFTEVCTKAYEHARKNVADGAAKGMAYFIEVQKRIDAATPAETPQISTETAGTTELSAETTKAEEAPKYSIIERDGNVYVTFKRGVIRQCAKRCGVSCKSAEWDTIAQAYNGIHSDMGRGLSFLFDGREDAVRFAELVCNGDISGYYKLYMAKIIAEGKERKERIAEECAEYDAAQAHFAECMADGTDETVNVSVEGENAAERAETPRYECPNYADYAFERGWYIENTDFDPHSGVLCMIHFDPSDEKYVCGCLWQIDSDKPSYTEHRRFKTLKGAQNYGTKRMGMKLEYQTLTVDCPITPPEPTQSPETSQTVEYTADTPKPRETARKRQNRATGCMRTTRQDTLRNTLRPVTYVPRECPTANAPPYW